MFEHVHARLAEQHLSERVAREERSRARRGSAAIRLRVRRQVRANRSH